MPGQDRPGNVGEGRDRMQPHIIIFLITLLHGLV